jgi:L-aminopeptidase/D-esterase-like protein
VKAANHVPVALPHRVEAVALPQSNAGAQRALERSAKEGKIRTAAGQLYYEGKPIVTSAATEAALTKAQAKRARRAAKASSQPSLAERQERNRKNRELAGR